MLGTSRKIRVLAYNQPVDMRKGFDGLAAVVTTAMERNPLDGSLFVFVSKNRKRAKVLYWDGTGLCILANNHVERALRGPVVGRKNHYGSRSEDGTYVAELFYSLLESAKLSGVEPRGYLLKATWCALESPGLATLPDDILNN